MDNKRGFVQISLDEYDQLKSQANNLDEILSSNKSVEISIYNPLYSNIGYRYVINPAPDFKKLAEEIKDQNEEARSRFWKLYHRRVSIRDIGRKFKDLL